MWTGRASVTPWTSSNPRETQVTVCTEEGPPPVQRAPGRSHCSPAMLTERRPVPSRWLWAVERAGHFPAQEVNFRHSQPRQNQPEGLLNAAGGWASESF